MPRLPAVIIVFLFFVAVLIFLLFVLVPMLTAQLSALVQQFPSYINQGLALLEQLPERYPQMVNEDQIERVTRSVGSELAGLGQSLVSWSLASVASAVGLLIFLVSAGWSRLCGSKWKARLPITYVVKPGRSLL